MLLPREDQDFCVENRNLKYTRAYEKF